MIFHWLHYKGRAFAILHMNASTTYVFPWLRACYLISLAITLTPINSKSVGSELWGPIWSAIKTWTTFSKIPTVDKARRMTISRQINIEPRVIAIWFISRKFEDDICSNFKVTKKKYHTIIGLLSWDHRISRHKHFGVGSNILPPTDCSDACI